MQAVDQHDEFQKHHKKKLIEYNSKFLRLQMKQKKESDTFSNIEHANFSENYQIAPQEDPEHLQKVINYTGKRNKQESEFRVMQRDNVKALAEF